MNLSDKIVDTDSWHSLVISKKDVKQFIKEIKEDIQNECGAITQARLYSKIDKLAGDKLI